MARLIISTLLAGALGGAAFASRAEALPIMVATGNLVPSPPLSLDASNASANSFNFNINLGMTFISISKVEVTNMFASSDLYDNGEGWLIAVGSGGFGNNNVFSTTATSFVRVSSGQLLTELLDGQFSSTYSITNGTFDLSSLVFSVTGQLVYLTLKP